MWQNEKGIIKLSHFIVQGKLHGLAQLQSVLEVQSYHLLRRNTTGIVWRTGSYNVYVYMHLCVYIFVLIYMRIRIYPYYNS